MQSKLILKGVWITLIVFLISFIPMYYSCFILNGDLYVPLRIIRFLVVVGLAYKFKTQYEYDTKAKTCVAIAVIVVLFLNITDIWCQLVYGLFSKLVMNYGSKSFAYFLVDEVARMGLLEHMVLAVLINTGILNNTGLIGRLCAKKEVENQNV